MAHRTEPDAEADIILAPTASPMQLRDLRLLGYLGPTPSTAPQAAALLSRLRSTPRAVRKKRKKAAPQ